MTLNLKGEIGEQLRMILPVDSTEYRQFINLEKMKDIPKSDAGSISLDQFNQNEDPVENLEDNFDEDQRNYSQKESEKGEESDEQIKELPQRPF